MQLRWVLRLGHHSVVKTKAKAEHTGVTQPRRTNSSSDKAINISERGRHRGGERMSALRQVLRQHSRSTRTQQPRTLEQRRTNRYRTMTDTTTGAAKRGRGGRESRAQASGASDGGKKAWEASPSMVSAGCLTTSATTRGMRSGWSAAERTVPVGCSVHQRG